MMSPVLAALVLTVSSAEPASSRKVADAVILGVSGAVAIAGYTTGAILTGDHPAGHPLAIVGGATTLGTIGASIGLLINNRRDDPGSIVGYILTPVLAGIAGAALGGVLAHFGAREAGPARTATHGVIIGLMLTDVLLLELARVLD